ncbi:MAG: hypothetical protein AAB074_06070 [Planctomycetota bacterium]
MRNLHPVPDSIVAKIQTFLLQPIPPNGSQFRRKWEDQCRSLPPGADEVLLETLRRGTPAEQDSALVALRSLGWTVMERGEIGDKTYMLRARTEKEWQTIRPMLQLD